MKRLIRLVMICAPLLYVQGCEQKPIGPSTMESLSVADQTLVKNHYEELLKAHEARNFALMLEHSNVILGYVRDYNDTRAYDAIARRGIASSENPSDNN